MKRILIITGIVVAGFFGLIGAAWIALFHTAPGRNFIIAQAEPAIAGALGGEAEIGAFKGAPPHRIILEDIKLSDTQGTWASVERIELKWRPLALINRSVRVDALIIEDATLLREAPSKPEADDEPDEPFSISLPKALPDIQVEEIRIANFRSELGGVSAVLNGGGRVAMGGQSVDMQLNLESSNGADALAATARVSPDAESILIDVTLNANEDGLIAALADLGGPITASIQSDSPTDNAAIELNAAIGAYGTVEATLLADLKNAVAVNAAGRFTSGAALADIPELAAPVAFDLDLEDREQGGALTINRISSAAGELAGAIDWRNMRGRDNEMKSELSFDFADDYRTEIQEIVGDAIAASASLQRRADDYGYTLSATGDGVAIAIEDGASDLRKQFAGALSATVAAEKIKSFPPQATTLNARFSVNLDNEAQLSALSVNAGDAFRAAGEGAFSFVNSAIRFEGDITASPSFVTTLAPSVSPAGPLSATIEASGGVDAFTLIAEADTPRIAIGENAAPGLIANVSLSGLPRLPVGEIKANAKNGSGAFTAQLRSSVNGDINVPSLDYQGPGFSLTGSGAFNPDTWNGAIDLVYNGAQNAQPAPGVSLVGSVNAKGVFARDGEQTELSITSPSLRANDATIQNLFFTANGSPEAINASLRADAISPGGGDDIQNILLATTIDAQNDITIRLRQVNALFAENQLGLVEEGTITLGDEIIFDNMRLSWGRNGRINADGAFSSARWRGAFNLTEINVPNTDSRINLNVDLDTDAAEPARGAFAVRSLIAEEEASLSGDLNWNGDSLTLSSMPDTDALDMRLALPVALTRSDDALSLSTEGPLDGYVRYDGAIEPFTAFLPPDLQTFEGFLTVDFQIAGSTTAPELSGVAEITDGAYTELRSGLSIAGIRTRADASYAPAGSKISFSGGARGAGQTGEDTIVIGGDMTLSDASRMDLFVELKNAEVSAFPVSSIRADGRIDVKGPLDAIAAEGEITLRELNAEIVAPESTGLVAIEVVNVDDLAEQSQSDAPPPSSATFDIKIIADDRIFVRGRGVESEWAANLRAISDEGDAIVLGSINLRRGTLDFSGRRFDITTGRIAFDRLSSNNPSLDIQAEYETNDGTTARIVVSGRAAEPSIELTSTPTLPQEDVVALVLFGKPASALTAFESLQTAQALASLGGIGPFGGSGGLTGSIRQATGLDLLNFDVDPENGGGSLTVGKYVADGLFVSATQDAQGDSGAVRVEYEITDNISVETEIRQEGDQTVSANWKKDF
ncbi:MAG: translocation/assembly module TamB domain-containing protein [Pseudomonadota bacterium]